ncbi:hypothetical protein MMPV_003574 [Pyropia vietnamensis]
MPHFPGRPPAVAGASAEEADAAFRSVLGFRDGERVEGYTDRMCGYMALYAAVAQTELPPGVVAAVAAVAAAPPGRLDAPAGGGSGTAAHSGRDVFAPPRSAGGDGRDPFSGGGGGVGGGWGGVPPPPPPPALDDLWAVLARLANGRARRLSASLAFAALEVSGAALAARYGRQYGKLLLALRRALVVAPPAGAPPAATSRLDALVDEYLEGGGRGVEPPPGRDLPLVDTVINA